MAKFFKFSAAELCLMVYYTWYFLPIMRTAFTGIFNYVFFAFFMAGMGLLVLKNLYCYGKSFKFSFTILVPIAIYMLTMVIMTLFRIGDAGEHIRVSFTFWGTAFVYYLLGVDKDSRSRFGIFLILLVAVTYVTSLIGIIQEPNAARALTNASDSKEALEADHMLGMMNISSIYLFQSLAVMSPVFVFMIKKGKVMLGLSLLVLSGVAIIQASFTICLLVFIAGVIFSLLFSSNKLSTFIIVVLLIVVLFIPWGEVFGWLENAFAQNDFLRTRLGEMATFFDNGYMSGDMKTRGNAYMVSVETFFNNPFGVGPQYIKTVNSKGIGYHSQLFDDLARFGLFALVFYAVFLACYGRLLYSNWKKVNMGEIAVPVVLVYFCFLMLNLAFRSAEESVLVLYLLPAIPEVIEFFKTNNYLQTSNIKLTEL